MPTRAVGEVANECITLPLSQIILVGAIEFSRGSLVIMDSVKLVQIAGFDENYPHPRLQKERKA